MMRKLQEMGTVGSVFVTRDCYPDFSSGGWGGNRVTPGTVGYQWKIYSLTNAGSHDGFTFPPGSGIMNTPNVQHSSLDEEEATVTTSTVSLGGSPLSDVFQLVINGEETGSIPYNIDSFWIPSKLFRPWHNGVCYHRCHVGCCL